MFGRAACLAADAPSTRPVKETYLRIANEVEANLQKEILEKFFPVTVDEQGGGFYENYSLNWTRTAGSNKSIVYPEPAHLDQRRRPPAASPPRPTCTWP